MEDPHIITIREFVDFANSVDKKSKQLKNLHRWISKPTDLTPDTIISIKEEARKCFADTDFNDVKNSDWLVYKSGSVSLGKLKKMCAKKSGDMEDFQDFMDAFKALYMKENESVDRLLAELELESNSDEAMFLKKVFNELGEDFMDFVNGHEEGEDFDMTKLLSKGTAIYKSGKLNSLMEDFTGSSVKMSKILFAVGKLMERYENSQEINDENNDKDGESSSSDKQ